MPGFISLNWELDSNFQFGNHTVKFWKDGVSVQGVKSLGGHFAFLCRGFDFYEVNTFFYYYYFKKRKGKYFYTFNHFYSEKSSKREKSTNLLV